MVISKKTVFLAFFCITQVMPSDLDMDFGGTYFKGHVYDQAGNPQEYFDARSRKYEGSASLAGAIKQWKDDILKYEAETGERVQDGVKVAILLNRTTGTIQEHLRLNSGSTKDYQQAIYVILNYVRAKHQYEPTPMDIGHVGKRKEILQRQSERKRKRWIQWIQ